MNIKYLLLSLAFLSGLQDLLAQENWVIDKKHSSVGFEVDHLMISTVSGHFSEFGGELELSDGKLANGMLSGYVTVASIDTGDPDRDKHLLEPDFLHCEKYERMTFISTSIVKKSDNEFLVIGNLKIKDVTRLIRFSLDYNGRAIMSGNQKMGLSAQLVINRFDYNIQWNELLDTGNMMVGKDITIQLNFELNAVTTTAMNK